MKYLFFLFLYSLQGIPYGLESRFLPIVLRSKGISLKTLGFFKLFSVPWLLKFLFAPFVDGYLSYRTWVVLTLTLISSVCSLLAFNEHFISVEGVKFQLPCVFLTYNILCATLDIAVDALAINKLGSDDLFLGNTVQVVGYRLGMLIGAGFFTFLTSYIDVSYIFLFLTALYVTSASVSFLHPILSIGQSRQTAKPKPSSSNSNLSYVERIKMAMKVPSTFATCVFLSLYKIGEAPLLSMLPLFFVDQGFSNAQISFFTAILGQLSSIFGSTYSFVFIRSQTSLLEAIKKLAWYIFVVSTPIYFLAYFLQQSTNTEWKFLLFYLLCITMNLNQLISGCLTTCSFSLMMQCTMQRQVATTIYATHYTLLSTVDTLAKLAISMIAPFVIDAFGYSTGFFIFVLLNLSPCIFMKIEKLSSQLEFNEQDLAVE